MINRRSMMKGGGAIAAAFAFRSASVAEAAQEATNAWVKVAEKKMWRIHYRIMFTPTFSPTYAAGENVMVKFLSGPQDRRRFSCRSLKDVDGKVYCVIPPYAMPWRYLQARKDIPFQFRMSIKKSGIRTKSWRARWPAKRYVVKTKTGTVLVPAQRMRSMEIVPGRVNLMGAE